MTSEDKSQQLNKLLQDKLSLSEFKQLCFDLSVNYDDLEGDTRSVKMQSLIVYLRARNRLDEAENWLTKRLSDSQHLPNKDYKGSSRLSWILGGMILVIVLVGFGYGLNILGLITIPTDTLTPIPTDTLTPIPTDTLTPIPTDTPTPIPTDTLTPIPTDTPTPIPTRTLRDKFIDIQQVANDTIQSLWPNYSASYIETLDVDFRIFPPKNKASSECGDGNNWQEEFTVNLDVTQVESVHILETGGYLTTEFQDKVVGEIELNFQGKLSLTEELIAGQNIREWRYQTEGAITSAPDAQAVYTGTTKAGDLGRLDMVSFVLPDSHKGGSLESIIFRDTANSSTGGNSPCFSLFAITVKTRE